MGTATVDNQTVEFEDGPYLYDDPRFIYNEPCMFYDGGFDIQCLLGRQVILPKKIGKRTAKPSQAVIYKRQERPKRDKRVVLDICIEVDIVSVNDKNLDFPSQEKKYHLEYTPIIVATEAFKHKMDDFKVFAQTVTSSIKAPIFHPTGKIKLLPIKIFVSSSLFEHRTKKENIILKGEIISIKPKKKEDEE